MIIQGFGEESLTPVYEERHDIWAAEILSIRCALTVSSRNF